MKQYADCIEQRQESEIYAFMHYGEDYYTGRNTEIYNRSKRVYLENYGAVSNPFQANHKIATGYFKKIVDQKVMYLLGNGATFAEDDGSQVTALDDYFKTSFDECLIDAGTQASMKAESWLYWYKDTGRLKAMLIPAEQIIPIYDDYDQLEKVIRRYKVGGKEVTLIIDGETIERWERKALAGEKEYQLVKTTGHYAKYTMQAGRMVGEPDQHSFDRVPFTPLYNNPERLSDLYPIKGLIDIIDITLSDFANNIDDMQEAFFTLKGYAGETQHLTEFMKQLKQIKAVPVSEDGDVKAQQLIIPVEAREKFLDRAERRLFSDAMAVNFEGSQAKAMTATEIRSMLVDLDLKADRFENEMRRFITQIIEFINANDNKNFSDEVMFSRSMIMNRTEELGMIVGGQAGASATLSRQTQVELLAKIFDIDPQKEMERLEEQGNPYPTDITDIPEPDETEPGGED